MRIKSLLLGSAAALVAVSGARAADAIIAEPEPVEYVRVCDVYGTGFFYIPGTETCLRISGFVRYQINYSEAVVDHDDDGIADFDFSDGWNKRSQVAVNFDARTDTEWGLLRGYINLESGSNLGLTRTVSRLVDTDLDPLTPPVLVSTEVGEAVNGDNIAGSRDFVLPVNRAILQLGGVWMGYTDTLFVSSSVQLGSPLGNYGTFSPNGLQYGYQQRQQIGYQFTGGNGFYGAVSLEHDPAADGIPDDDYMPNVVGKLAWATGWGGIYGVVGYDEDASGFGVRVGAQFDMPNAPGSSFRLYGFYVSEPDVTYTPAAGADWSVVAAYFHRFNPAFGASLAFQHINFHGEVGGGSENIVELYGIWTPVPQFSVQLEVTHAFDADATAGLLRFERSF